MNINNFIPIIHDEQIELFGFTFYIDDLLILTIIYFLYKQEVTDKFLYIALFLLLINK